MKPPSKFKLWLCTPHVIGLRGWRSRPAFVWFFTCTALIVEFHTRKNCYEFAAKIERFPKDENEPHDTNPNH